MIIGITGYAQSGKDTVGNLLKNLLNINSMQEYLDDFSIYTARILGVSEIVKAAEKWEIAKFATPLKEVVNKLFSLPPDTDKTVQYSDTHTVRDLYQIVGTDIARKINPDIFVYKLFRSLDRSKSHIITDVRFPNEAEAIRNHGGIIIKKESSKIPENLHESESYVDSIEADYTIPWMNVKDDIFEVFEMEEKIIEYLEKHILIDKKFNYKNINND